MTDAPEQLSGYVDVWWEAVNDFTALLEKVPADAWDTPTDLPGWDVHAVAAHVGHLESLLAGNDHDDVEIGDAPHARGMMGQFTEQGVVARRDRTPDELINEIRSCTTARHTPAARRPADRSRRARARAVRRHRLEHPDPAAQPAARHLDARAGRTPRARDARRDGHPRGATQRRLPRREPGLRARQEAEGRARHHRAAGGRGTRPGRRDRDRRGPRAARSTEVPDDPTVGLRTDRESFVVLAGGRRRPDAGRVEIFGDEDLGQQLLDHLAVTP